MAPNRLVAVVVVFFCGVLGCSTPPQADDDPPTEQHVEQQDDEEHDGPHVEELADNPCAPGNWDEPPPEVTSIDQ